MEGRRDNDLFHAANALINARTPIEEVEQYLEILAENSNPPFPLSEISEKIKSALKRVERRERNIAQEVREWVEATRGHFEATQSHRELHLATRLEMRAVNVALCRLVEEGILERYGDKRGVYRRVDKDYEVIDFVNASDEIFPIKWPFNIERYVEICPGNPIIIAGEKDAGKTAFLLNCVQMNMNAHRIFYFSSEMGDREIKKRLLKFGISLKQWKFTVIERASNFSDVIQPDDINVIDFLEVYQDFYKIGLYIREICDKLNKGIAIIALQKNPGVDWGLGGMRSMEKARLYLSIEKGRIKIVSGKNWASETNPVGLQLDFKLVQGCKFIVQRDWYKG
ncbi:MAG: primase C-terminal domain-containing protein [Thermodesulfobacteriota bacterium]